MIDIKASSSPKVSGITGIVSFTEKPKRSTSSLQGRQCTRKTNDMKYYYIIDEMVSKLLMSNVKTFLIQSRNSWNFVVNVDVQRQTLLHRLLSQKPCVDQPNDPSNLPMLHKKKKKKTKALQTHFSCHYRTHSSGEWIWIIPWSDTRLNGFLCFRLSTKIVWWNESWL